MVEKAKNSKNVTALLDPYFKKTICIFDMFEI